ncbi:MAG: heme-binding protein [Clostridia bacterium]|nr:heme-binding protein [Clostridia bacterium]
MQNQELSEIVAKVVQNLTSKKISLALAKTVADKIQDKAKELGVNAVIAICDKGANPILVHSMDDAYIASYDIAVNKAFTCASLKMSTKTLSGLAQPGKSLYGIQFTNQGKIVIFGGGEPLEVNGEVIGGLGVSGGSEEQDTLLGAYGKSVFETEISKL